jgi:hypothetical protein
VPKPLVLASCIGLVAATATLRVQGWWRADDRFFAGPENEELGPIWMPRGAPNSEIGIEQMADDVAAKKSSAAKYSHASQHIARRSTSAKLFASPLFKQTKAGIDRAHAIGPRQ